MEHQSEEAVLVIDAMKRAERSQKWTARKAGIALTTFGRKLNGGSAFTLGEVARIAHALGVHPADLLPSEFDRETDSSTEQKVA